MNLIFSRKAGYRADLVQSCWGKRGDFIDPKSELTAAWGKLDEFAELRRNISCQEHSANK